MTFQMWFRCNVTKEAEMWAMCFEDGERGRKSRNMTITLEPPKRLSFADKSLDQ